LPPPPLLLPPLPQPSTPQVRTTSSISNPSMVFKERRRAGMPNNRTQAIMAPPADGQNSFNDRLRAVAAVVLTVSVAACAVAPLMVTEAGMLHVAGSVAAAGAMAQLSVTTPVKPLYGVMVMVELLPVVAPGMTLIGVPVREKVGGGVVVKELIVPLEVPTLLWATI